MYITDSERRMLRNQTQARYRENHKKEIMEYGRSYNERNREERRLNAKAYHQKNKSWRNEGQRIRSLKNADKLKEKRASPAEKQKQARRRFKKYGITEDDYIRMIKKQSSRCKICDSEDWGFRGPHIDHNHKTGKVRGILCQRCNLVLGIICEDQQIAIKMAQYIYTGNKNHGRGYVETKSRG